MPHGKVLGIPRGAWMGVPVWLSEYVALVGSTLLVIAAYISLFQVQPSLYLSAVSVPMIGYFWVVGILRAYSQIITSPLSALPSLLVCVGLGLVTWLTVRSVRKTEKVAIDPNVRWRVLMISCVIALCWTSLLTYDEVSTHRTPNLYLIPAGYVGWIEIRYNSAGASPLLIQARKQVLSLPKTGMLYTSSLQPSGWAKDEYFYESSAHIRQPLTETGWGKGGKIWGNQSGVIEGQGGLPDCMYEQFFVGTEQQYYKSQSLPQERYGVVAGDLSAYLH
jgi:hypothetical protein